MNRKDTTDVVRPAKVAKLPPEIDKSKLIDELTAAHAAVGELRGLLGALPEPSILIAPFRKREAVASSAIEGTRATLEDVLKFEALDKKDVSEEAGQTPIEVEQSRRHFEDIIEIMNYEKAMEIAMDTLKVRPIGENLLKKVHAVLLNSGRGADKDRGNFRRGLVSVGDYIPPLHTDIPGLIDNWEKFLHDSELQKDFLIRIGIAHYQFEAIHPFRDGNGRIGRLVIPLFMCQIGILPTPVLYISHYLEVHKKQYQKLLHKIDTDQEWIPWLKFFLTAVKEQAEMTAAVARKIQDLYERLIRDVIPKIDSQYAMPVLDLLFQKQIISAKNVRLVISAKSKNTPYHLLDKFVEYGILQKPRQVGKENIYIFKELLRIINS